MLKVVFFGTPRFAATILDYLLQKKANIVAVVTKPDKPQGRNQELKAPPVKVLAERHNLPLFQPQKASAAEFASVLEKLDADLFFVVAYSEIFKENLLKMPRLGCVNVHASLLPAYRGAAPIHRSVMAGDKETGVTIMSMAKELDAGEILAVAKTPISEEATTGELFETLSHLGAQALWDVLCQFEEGKVQGVAQDPSKVTYAAKVTSDEAWVDWSKPAWTLHNHIRGLNPKPGAWANIWIRGERKRLLIKKTHVESQSCGRPGEILNTPGFVVGCGEGALSLDEVQLEGKKALNSKEFLRGFPKEELYF